MFFRLITAALQDRLAHLPAILLTGPRQAGKTTLLRAVCGHGTRLDLASPFVRRRIAEDPLSAFEASVTRPIVIDEMQYDPSILEYVRIEIDARRAEAGQFAIAGSQSLALMQSSLQSLAGRVSFLELLPLSWKELGGAMASHGEAFWMQLSHGFYPEIFSLEESRRPIWLSDYITSYIERDVRLVVPGVDLLRFSAFLESLAVRSGQVLNLSEVARDVKISESAARDWLSILELTYVIKVVRPYHSNISTRVIKSPKLFFLDTGVLCFLLNLQSGRQLSESRLKGQVFETLVVGELLKRLSLHVGRHNVFFFRSRDGLEVDLLVQQGQQLHAIEVKATQTPRAEDTQALLRLNNQITLTSMNLLTLCPDTFTMRNGVVARPWHDLDFCTQNSVALDGSSST